MRKRFQIAVAKWKNRRAVQRAGNVYVYIFNQALEALERGDDSSRGYIAALDVAFVGIKALDDDYNEIQ